MKWKLDRVEEMCIDMCRPVREYVRVDMCVKWLVEVGEGGEEDDRW